VRSSARIWRHFDVWLLAAVAVLSIAGIAMIRSAIGGNENLAELVPRQAIYAGIGLLAVLVAAAIDYRLWAALARPIYLLILIALAIVLIAGFVGFGAARWFSVGIVLIQPSELARIFMIVILASYLARHLDELNRPRILLGSSLVILLPAVLVFFQPDLSTAVDLGVVWLSLIWAAGLRPSRLAAMLGVGSVLPVAIWPLLAEYQRSRLLTFLLPEAAAQYGETYNVNQALIAIGSGGLVGQGYGQGTQVQLRFLKVRHTDFIFSSLAHEFGWVGSILVLLLIMFVVYRCLRAARMARDPFGALICYGVAIMILFQSSFNVAMNLKLLPVSGLPLPFLSYGGSSLVANLFAIGLVESVILRHKRLDL